ncbi:MAG: hypothetical protein KDD53_12185, partial [Bdellovibrionales bacterium]|nr:hypothetical protein [Bdellovibrionales bacterium]
MKSMFKKLSLFGIVVIVPLLPVVVFAGEFSDLILGTAERPKELDDSLDNAMSKVLYKACLEHFKDKPEK